MWRVDLNEGKKMYDNLGADQDQKGRSEVIYFWQVEKDPKVN